MKSVKLTVSALAVIAASASVAAARDQVQVAGSSTVLPYANIVAEAFAENSGFAAPVVEGGGSSAGLKQFCEGVGENTIDVANASRKIKDSEIETCKANGVANIIEVQFGYDGIVFASDINGPDFALTPKDVFLALAGEVVVDGVVTANAAANWSDVNPDLPAQPIMAFIPGTKHGTREVFEEKVMKAGCEESGALDAFKAANADEKAAEAACIAIRTDGKSVDVDGDYPETLARIESDKNGVGVFGLSFYESNTTKLKVATINGVTPSVETVASAEYPVSRPLFFYVKKDHIGVIPGLKEYAEFFVSDAIAGPGGPLSSYGLVPDPELATVQQTVADEAAMQ
ncbi:MAG TPA: substrate-binding domain-containing protein [Paracoccus sp. (in: a-proteobacteria)]|uniref:PstS family phosphate ABC transporter substrate-binding protein n=1 Tax=uncultured Paracoccus sp. TaxID=189685 RepID=UPI0026178575|nr:substrate-binding domain-containing protein [uncultured Paracoccus sp.]HMQ41326.1 substrate-binding domain-containing protein [Paracoccus sp. (in: a-proteobacteria)]HMR36471.1 substrate-binding domain-containing protein [Paracoccus sp. (in: a-proteobacteria)]